MKVKIIVQLLILFISFNLYAQERLNNPDLDHAIFIENLNVLLFGLYIESRICIECVVMYGTSPVQTHIADRRRGTGAVDAEPPKV